MAILYFDEKAAQYIRELETRWPIKPGHVYALLECYSNESPDVILAAYSNDDVEKMGNLHDIFGRNICVEFYQDIEDYLLDKMFSVDDEENIIILVDRFGITSSITVNLKPV